MSRRGGRRTQLVPSELVAYIATHTSYVTGGIPKRRRLCINGRPVTETDARMIRRWRAGTIKGVTADSATALLQRYDLPLPE